MSKIKTFLIILYTAWFLVKKYNCSVATLSLLSSENADLMQYLSKIKSTLQEISPSMKITITTVPPNCVQIQCKFICLHGKAGEIDKDINKISQMNNELCPMVDELRIYDYEFPNQTIARGFLGEYEQRVVSLHIASSNVTHVEGGAFANGRYQKLTFENLYFEALEKNFFEGISNRFQTLVMVQRNKPLQYVNSNFLDHVKYQIKKLVMQVGLPCVRNLTASDNLLNTLNYADFSYNNFGDQLLANTFNKLSMVQHLDLSNSHISYLPDYIFGDLMSTLEYLNLENNHIKTVSRLVFGWREIPRDVEIIMDNNDWHCTCKLQTEMKHIYVYTLPILFCATPAAYSRWVVFDERICSNEYDYNDEEAKIEVATSTTYNFMPTMGHLTTTTTKMPHYITTYRPYAKDTTTNPNRSTERETSLEPITNTEMPTTRRPPDAAPPNINDPSIVQLQCRSGADIGKQHIKWPSLGFDVTYKPTLRVDVLIKPEQQLDLYGLIWFSKVTKQYYKMEINYNDFGLGCYGNIAYTTTVEQLLPNVAYTFCLVLRNQLTVSPFSCQSVHVDGNLNVQYNAWLTRGMRATGISLIVFGVVMFGFVGILMSFLVLKRKPTLLKGSKRVTTTKANSGEIVVLPKAKTKESFKMKEELLAKRNSKGTTCCLERRDSTGSTVSYQSYINTNLYEVIPAYLKFSSDASNATKSTAIYDFQDQLDSTYMAPLRNKQEPLTSTDSSANLVSYAEIPYRSKRASNDPLPAVPQNETPLTTIALYEYAKKHDAKMADTSGNIDSQM